MSLLRINEIAPLLRVSPDTVRRLVKSGKIKAMRIGRQMRVDSQELAAYMRQSGIVFTENSLSRKEK